jgi:hypothetical protein
MKHSGADYSAELTSRAWNPFVSRPISVAHGGEESIASADAGVFRADRASRSDDGFDFPPAAYPGRELFTATLSVLLIVAVVLWGGWKLTALLASLV